MREFVDGLDTVNAAAERSPGFVWRHVDIVIDGAYTIPNPWPDDIIVNISVWEDVDSLRAFTCDDLHRYDMQKRRSWFRRMRTAHLALWWVDRGHQPSLAEAHAKINLLDQKGPTPDSFTFKHTSIRTTAFENNNHPVNHYHDDDRI
ncbi:hypothetical protein CTAYLR_010696 [Chrysophaeum taylorii]|uniref:DUF3291 domain-containing protein n=1 Tax=Chrysophaeum taylorii TaxID=2483200 RepID=A0AAD7UBF7_9STRA|nr:hypothetical protein CTAYLR_010696 [Chrysophaeum taylorii]